MSLHNFAEWLASTEWSIALHESLYMYAIIESTHVIFLTLFVGTILMLDLRLMGWAFKDIPVSQVASRLLPWTVAGFIIMVVTGVLLFYAIPVRTYHSIFFRVKVILLILAGINAWWFHRKAYRSINTWDLAPVPPKPARVAGALSLSFWACIIVLGRMIAYNWFDCDSPQSKFISWAAECANYSSSH